MTTYALLGATGATGSSVLRCLLDDPAPELRHINILVRSKTKLLQTFPRLTDPPATSKLQIHIFEGDATSPAALMPCLTNASTILVCIGQNNSSGPTTLQTSTVTALVTSLSHLRSAAQQNESPYQPPTILHLRSASLNPWLASHTPRLVHKTVAFCLHHTYADLGAACALYPPAASAGLLSYIFIDPPTIHDPLGTVPTGYQLLPPSEGKERQATALSYADLGAAMCEVAERAAEFAGQAVGVSATGVVKTGWRVLGGHLVGGFVGRVKGGVAKGLPLLYAPMAPFFGVGVGMYGGFT